MKEGYVWNRRWLWVLILFALSFVLSYLQPMRMAEGGEVTYLSILVLYLIGYFYGGGMGIAAAVAFGAAKYLWDYSLTVNVAELWDYILGYGLVGLGGFFAKGKEGLRRGYLAAMGFRYLESVVNCVIFYYVAGWSLWGNIRYGIVYCLGYLGVEALITILILAIRPVRESIDYVKYVATNDYEEDLDSF